MMVDVNCVLWEAFSYIAAMCLKEIILVALRMIQTENV